MSTTQESSTSSVTTAAKRPAQTTTFLTNLKTSLSIFDDEISSLGEEHTTAYKTFVTGYKNAFTDIWPKIKTADVTALLSSVKDTELRALKRLSEQLCPDTKPTLIKEKRDMPTPDDILGGLVSRLPEQKLPGKEACSLIADIFSDLAEAHKFYARATKALADIAGLVSPEQLTLILACGGAPDTAACYAARSVITAIHPATTPGNINYTDRATGNDSTLQETNFTKPFG